MKRLIRCEDIPGHPDFRALAALPDVAHDLRYACARNFMGRPLYLGLDCAWLRREAAEGLEAAAQHLAQAWPGYRLCVLDALRPQRVQQAIWRSVAGTPMAPYFADPAIGSNHSFGMAVDVVLIDPHGRECDMGSGFDEMSPRSHPALEAEHLARGVLTPAQVEARHRLNGAMAHGGFQGIRTEWWHFNFGEPARVRREVPLVD